MEDIKTQWSIEMNEDPMKYECPDSISDWWIKKIQDAYDKGAMEATNVCNKNLDQCRLSILRRCREEIEKLKIKPANDRNLVCVRNNQAIDKVLQALNRLETNG